MWLFTAFGAVALLIAAVGVYATTAYGLSRRRREMNIRVALGARASQVFALVVRQSVASLMVGIGAGAAGALALGSVVASLLFEGASTRSARRLERGGARRRRRRARVSDRRASSAAPGSRRGAQG
jgi:ABC-type antimicrobial peptide transport system permease subunit